VIDGSYPVSREGRTPTRAPGGARERDVELDLLAGGAAGESYPTTAFAKPRLVPATARSRRPVVRALGPLPDGEGYLAKGTSPRARRRRYVTCFIDCRAVARTPRGTVNALRSVRPRARPVQAERSAVLGLEGWTQLLAHRFELSRAGSNRASASAVASLTHGCRFGGAAFASSAPRPRVEERSPRHFGELVLRNSVPRSVRMPKLRATGMPAIALRR